MTMFDKPVQRLVLVMILLLAAGLPSSGLAQEGAGDAQAIRAELRDLQQSLTQLREQAMAENPALERRQQAFQDQVLSRMRDEGVEPRKSIRRLQDISRQLQAGEVAESERRGLMTEYQEMRSEVMAARRVAMQDQKIIDAEASLRSEMLAAMREQDADAPAMIERFENLRRELAESRGRQAQ